MYVSTGDYDVHSEVFVLNWRNLSDLMSQQCKMGQSIGVEEMFYDS